MKPQELKDWRNALGMTQLAFSQWIKPTRTPSIICQWEGGKRPIPEWMDSLKELDGFKKA